MCTLYLPLCVETWVEPTAPYAKQKHKPITTNCKITFSYIFSAEVKCEVLSKTNQLSAQNCGYKTNQNAKHDWLIYLL